MAYSPVGQGGALLRSRALASVASRHGATPAQVAIAWGLRHSGVISIPKAADLAHVRENAAASDLMLDAEDLAAIDAERFPDQLDLIDEAFDAPILRIVGPVRLPAVELVVEDDAALGRQRQFRQEAGVVAAGAAVHEHDRGARAVEWSSRPFDYPSGRTGRAGDTRCFGGYSFWR